MAISVEYGLVYQVISVGWPSILGHPTEMPSILGHPSEVAKYTWPSQWGSNSSIVISVGWPSVLGHISGVPIVILATH